MVDGDFDVDVFVFDLFGVVIDFDDAIFYSRLARHCPDPAAATARLDGVLAGYDFGTGRATLAAVHRQLVAAHGLTLSYLEFEAVWREPYTWAMPGMAPLLERLAGRYRLVLLSNIDRDYWPVVRAAHPELDRFSALLLSCELGALKPEPEIFLRACRIANTTPARCFFVDDSEVNVAAARRLGFRTHRFRGVAGLVARLRREGVTGLDGSA
jgi:HAD superfamily hydrolase (TIGR01509 family)